MMTVAIFTDNDFDKTNGVTTTLGALMRHAPADLHLRVYTLSAFDVDEAQYLAVRSVSAPIPFYGEMQLYVPRMVRLRRSLDADGVRLLHLTTPGPVGLAATYFASRYGLPLVGSFHTNLGEYATILSGSKWIGRSMDAYMRWLYGRCARVLVPSFDTLDRLAAAGWSADRLAVWPRGVDAATFSPERRSPELRERWRVCERRPAVLYAGRVSREKGLGLLETLGSLLRRRHIAHRLIVVGDGPMYAEVRQRCPDAVFTGKLSHADVGAAMASADLFVFPSATDTAGNVVLEAQASGLPVIVADAGGPRENMRNGSTGYVCRAGDAEDFASRVAGLLLDPARRASMGLAARSYAEARTWALALRPVYNMYRSVLTGSVGTRIDRPLPVTHGAASRV